MRQRFFPCQGIWDLRPIKLLRSKRQQEPMKLHTVYTGTTETYCQGTGLTPPWKHPSQRGGQGWESFLSHMHSGFCAPGTAERTHVPPGHPSPSSFCSLHTCTTFIPPEGPETAHCCASKPYLFLTWRRWHWHKQNQNKYFVFLPRKNSV